METPKRFRELVSALKEDKGYAELYKAYFRLVAAFFSEIGLPALFIFSYAKGIKTLSNIIGESYINTAMFMLFLYLYVKMFIDHYHKERFKYDLKLLKHRLQDSGSSE